MSKWKKPSEELPEESLWVLGIDRMGRNDIIALNDQGEWYWPTHCECCSCFDKGDVIAWRELPADPKWLPPAVP